MKLDMNEDFIAAYTAMDTGQDSLFLTGKAGTGKSTLLRYFVENTTKNVAVVAPTGIAALNVRGQTVHRFCGFGSDVSLDAVARGRYRPRTRAQRAVLQRLNCLVVDEVSMLRADLLDCLQGYLSLYGPQANRPFGGVQMIFVGDLYQLPPVLLNNEQSMFQVFYDSPYFFSANCMKGLIRVLRVYSLAIHQVEPVVHSGRVAGDVDLLEFFGELHGPSAGTPFYHEVGVQPECVRLIDAYTVDVE